MAKSNQAEQNATNRKAGHGSVKALGGTGQKKGGYGKGNWGKAGESAEDLPLGERKERTVCCRTAKTCPLCAPVASTGSYRPRAPHLARPLRHAAPGSAACAPLWAGWPFLRCIHCSANLFLRDGEEEKEGESDLIPHPLINLSDPHDPNYDSEEDPKLTEEQH